MVRTVTVNVHLSDERVAEIKAHIDATCEKYAAAHNGVRHLHRAQTFATIVRCAECNRIWPCATARLVYTEDEITNPPTTP